MRRIPWLALGLLAGLAHGAGLPVFRFDAVAGGNAGFADGNGSAARFNQPSGIAVDAQGNIYVADTGNSAVRKVTPQGAVSTLATGFKNPTAVALDALGNLFIADTGNNAIRQIAPDGTQSTVATVPGPVGLAVDAHGNLWISDGNGDVGTLKGDGTLALLASHLPSASGIAVDLQGNVFVNEIGLGAEHVVKIDPTGAISMENISLVGGLQSDTAWNGVAVDQQGNLYAVSGPVDLPFGDLDSQYSTTLSGLAPDGSQQTYLTPFDTFPDFPPLGLPAPPAAVPVYAGGPAVDASGNLYLFLGNVLIKGSLPGAPPAPPFARLDLNEGGSVQLSLPAVAAASPQSPGWTKDGTVPLAPGLVLSLDSTQPQDAGVYTAQSDMDENPINFAFAVGVSTAPGSAYLQSWTSSAALPASATYPSLTFDGVNFVAAGTDGSLLVSSTAAQWTLVQSLPGRTNSLVTLPSGAVLGVGDNGLIYSARGPQYHISIASVPTHALLTGVAAGGGATVAVGYGGTVVFSPPSGGWSMESTGIAQNLNAVAYGGGVFVAVGLGGTVLDSSDGQTWTAQTLGSAEDLYSIAAGPAGFVAIGNDGTNSSIFISPDGVHWSLAQILPQINLIRIAFFHGAFVAAAGAGKAAWSADGGLSWQASDSGTTSTLEGVAFGAGTFVLTGSSGTVATSGFAYVRLLNLSARGGTTLSSPLTVGFASQGAAEKSMLVRGIGPALAAFGVTGSAAACQLTLYDAAGNTLQTNAGWGSSPSLAAIFKQVGAFSLPIESGDAAVLVSLPSSLYTASVAPTTSNGGVALAEIYDADLGTPMSHLVNLSALGSTSNGAGTLIAGFSVGGTVGDTLLLRGIGPSLRPFGIATPALEPVITVYDATGNILATQGAWNENATLQAAFAATGAFALPTGSKDAALLISVPPGVYTAQVSAAAGADGTALLEIYEVPSP